MEESTQGCAEDISCRNAITVNASRQSAGQRRNSTSPISASSIAADQVGLGLEVVVEAHRPTPISLATAA